MKAPRWYPTLWAVQWRSKNKLDGLQVGWIWHSPTVPALFRTRREARTFIATKYGYIKNRSDLRSGPHGWRLPQALKVVVTIWDQSPRKRTS